MYNIEELIKMETCKNEQLEELREIMQVLSDSIFSKPEVSRSKNGTYILSCESVMSAMNTIQSIDYCCKRGFYADAFTLVRKYRDDLFQYLFLLKVVSSIRGMTDEELSEYDITDVQSFMEMLAKEIEILDSGERKSEMDKAVEAWFFGTLIFDENEKDRKKYFGTSKYKSFIENSNDQVSFMMKTYFNDVWSNVNRILNNYVHANGYQYIVANYAMNIDGKQMLNEVVTVMQNVTSIFLCVLAVIAPTKMQSADYIDALELGIEPEQGSECWVDPCVVEYMDKYCKPMHQGLLQYIEENNGYGMKFLLSDYVK